MYQQRNSYYQYQEPVAMFSMAEVEKYNKYEKGDYAAFGLANAIKTPFRMVGGQAAKAVRGIANRAAQRLDDPRVTKLGINANRRAKDLGGMAEWAEKNPGKLGAGLLGAAGVAGAAGTGGAMFLRRRRTKKGKVVVEQVRR